MDRYKQRKARMELIRFALFKTFPMTRMQVLASLLVLCFYQIYQRKPINIPLYIIFFSYALYAGLSFVMGRIGIQGHKLMFSQLGEDICFDYVRHRSASVTNIATYLLLFALKGEVYKYLLIFTAILEICFFAFNYLSIKKRMELF